MSRAYSISTRRRYGMARVCDVWKVPRSTVYRHRVSSSAANATQPPCRRGPTGAAPDCVLLEKIRAVIASSPFSGEGYRKIWARLRILGIRTAARRVRRIMRENDLLAPHRPVQRDARAHDGAIVTERVDQVWGTDMMSTAEQKPATWRRNTRPVTGREAP